MTFLHINRRAHIIILLLYRNIYKISQSFKDARAVFIPSQARMMHFIFLLSCTELLYVIDGRISHPNHLSSVINHSHRLVVTVAKLMHKCFAAEWMDNWGVFPAEMVLIQDKLKAFRVCVICLLFHSVVVKMTSHVKDPWFKSRRKHIPGKVESGRASDVK